MLLITCFTRFGMIISKICLPSSFEVLASEAPFFPLRLESGSAVDGESTECADGTPTTMRGGEFDFRFVEAGTSTLMPAFERVYASFYDVDGDRTVRPSGLRGVRELVSVLGATSRTFAPSSTLEGGVFQPSEALYALASSNTNVPVDFNDAVSPSAARNAAASAA